MRVMLKGRGPRKTPAYSYSYRRFSLLPRWLHILKNIAQSPWEFAKHYFHLDEGLFGKAFALFAFFMYHYGTKDKGNTPSPFNTTHSQAVDVMKWVLLGLIIVLVLITVFSPPVEDRE